MSTSERGALEDSRSDIAKSVLSGALRFALPALCFVLLYGMILRQWGPDVFGLWSLFAAAQAFVSIADVGFSQSLMREAGPDVPPDRQAEVARDRVSTGLFFAIVTALAAVLCVLMYILTPPESGLYSRDGVWLAILLTVLGGGLKLTSRLDLALASAYRAVAASVRLQGYGQAVLLLIAFGTSPFFPIEGFALGFLVSGAFELVLARRLAAASGYLGSRQAISARILFSHVVGMIGRGRYMYLTSIGSAVRETLYRFVIAGFFGVAAAGHFDVSLRATKAAREVGVFGLSATFPYFAQHFRQGDRNASIDLIRWTFSLSLLLGSLPMGLLLALSRPIYQTWLGRLDEDVITTTAALTFWFWMTLVNLPFWYAALASNLDSKVAASVWFHSASVLLLVVLIPLGLDYHGTLAVWLVGAAATQMAIITPIAGQFGWRNVFSNHIMIQLGLSLALLAVCGGAALTGLGISNTTVSVGLAGTAALAAVSLVVVSRRELIQLIKLMSARSRGSH